MAIVTFDLSDKGCKFLDQLMVIGGYGVSRESICKLFVWTKISELIGGVLSKNPPASPAGPVAPTPKTISFELSQEGFNYLQELVDLAGFGGDREEVAKTFVWLKLTALVEGGLLQAIPSDDLSGPDPAP